MGEQGSPRERPGYRRESRSERQRWLLISLGVEHQSSAQPLSPVETNIATGATSTNMHLFQVELWEWEAQRERDRRGQSRRARRRRGKQGLLFGRKCGQLEDVWTSTKRSNRKRGVLGLTYTLKFTVSNQCFQFNAKMEFKLVSFSGFHTATWEIGTESVAETVIWFLD